MSKAGIAIEPWKLPIFTRHLDKGGFTFINAGNLSPEALLLTVETDKPDALLVVIKAAMAEAAALGAPNA